MDNQYLILLALFVMGIVGFAAVVLPDGSLVTSGEIREKLRLSGYDGVLYDSGGHGVCYYNLSAVAEAGHVVFYNYDAHAAMWRNGSFGAFTDFRLYVDTNGRYALCQDDFGVNGFEGALFMRGFGGGYDNFIGSVWMNVMSGAFVAIVVGAVAGAALLSVTVLGSGEKEYGVRVVVTVGFYSLLWVLVSAVGVSSLTGIPLFGWVFYGLLSFAYYLGVVLIVVS